jgi:hypothetical protein
MSYIPKNRLKSADSFSGIYARACAYYIFVSPSRKNKVQTVLTGSGGATYAPEDLPPTVAMLSLLSKSVASQALFSEKEPIMPENMAHLKVICGQMKTISDVLQKDLFTDENHTDTNKNQTARDENDPD